MLSICSSSLVTNQVPLALVLAYALLAFALYTFAYRELARAACLIVHIVRIVPLVGRQEGSPSASLDTDGDSVSYEAK